MTAGKGVAHSERTPEYLRTTDKNLHGLQIWVALPEELETMEPEFFHINKEDIPSWIDNGINYKLIAGEILGRKSPVPVYSPLYFLEVKNTLQEDREIVLGDYLFGESSLYILEGHIESEGNLYNPKHILIAKDSKLCHFVLKRNSIIYIFGGEPFPEPRYIYWNFVASSLEIIEDAKTRWENHEFPKVINDDGYVPLPPQNKNLKLKE